MGWTAKPSVQRMLVPADPRAVATDYFSWVDRVIPFVSVRRADESVSFHVFGINKPAIALKLGASDAQRVSYHVVGGFLARIQASSSVFSFERTEDSEVTISLLDFSPWLPPLVYRATHAVVHDVVMTMYTRRTTVAQLEEEI